MANNQLEEDIIAMRAGGASEQELVKYRQNWETLNGGESPTPGSEPSFGDIQTPEKDHTNPVQAIGALISGAVKGIGGALAFPVWSNEKIAAIPHRIYSGNWGKDGGTPISNFLNHGIDEASEAVKAFTNADTDSSLGLRYLESVGDNVTVGAAYTRGFTKWGSRLMTALPAETNALQRLAIEAAQNPKKIQALEAITNATSAVSGQTMYEMVKANGGSEDEAAKWRIATEILSGLGAASMQRFTAKVKDVAASKLILTPKAKQRRAEEVVGHFFDDVMNTDPRAAEKYLAARRIEDIYTKYTGDASGLELTTAQVLNTSPVTAAERRIVSSKPTSAIEAENHIRVQAEKTQNFIEAVRRKGPNQSIDQWHKQANDIVDRQINDLQSEIDLAAGQAEREAVTLMGDGDPVALGNLGRQKLDTLYEEMTSRVDEMYKTVEDVNIGIGSVKAGWKNAMASTLKGNKGGRVDNYLRDIYDLNFKDEATSSISKVREFQKIVRSEMRSLDPNSDTFRRLAILDDGIQNEFTRAASKDYETDLGKAAQHLEIANKLNKKTNDMFRSGQLKRLLAEDMQGLSVVSPEDFFNRFIRSNSQADRFKVANDFATAFGSPNAPGQARDLMRQAYLVQIRNIAIDPTTKTINTRAVANWLEKHSDNLKAFGLTGDFDNVGSVARAAAEIKSTNTIAIKDIEKSALAQSLKDDPKEFVKKQLEAGRLGKLLDLPLARLASDDRDVILRGYKQAAWEVLLDSTKKNAMKIGSGDTATLVRQPEILGNLLENNEKDLRRLLGNEHYDDLKAVQQVMEQTKPVHAARFEGPVDALVGSMSEERKIKRGVLAKIIAASRGFISPEYATASVLNSYIDSVSWKATEGVFERALKDPKMAKTLAEASRDKKTAHALRSIYSSVLAPFAQAENADQEDPTAGLKDYFD